MWIFAAAVTAAIEVQDFSVQACAGRTNGLYNPREFQREQTAARSNRNRDRHPCAPAAPPRIPGFD
jgi:hypothetical protein